MDRLFAPWRMDYIRSEPVDCEGCFLCDKLTAPPEDDRKNLVFYRGAHSFAMLNLYPYNNGHAMVAPNRHVGDFGELTPDEILEMNRIIQALVALFREKMSAQGFNIGFNIGQVAGAGCKDHIHAHIVPRWNGDTNFMPVLAETKVVSEALEATYNTIVKDIEAYVKKAL